MTPVSDIITQALRESNIVALGAAPSTAQSTEAFSFLKSLVAGVYGDDVGERVQDWLVGNAGVHWPYMRGWDSLRWKYPIANSRIILDHQSPQILYWPIDPDNGARMQVVDLTGELATNTVTIDANGRLIEGARTLVLNTNNLNRTWIFNADTSEWVVLDYIASDGEMPFPIEFDDYFIIKLAARLNPRYGRSLSDLSIARLSELQERLESTYRQTRNMPAPLAVRRLSDPNQRFFNGYNRRGRWGWQS